MAVTSGVLQQMAEEILLDNASGVHDPVTAKRRGSVRGFADIRRDLAPWPEGLAERAAFLAMLTRATGRTAAPDAT